jgi:hypothetical protein
MNLATSYQPGPLRRIPFVCCLHWYPYRPLLYASLLYLLRLSGPWEAISSRQTFDRLWYIFYVISLLRLRAQKM